jgi:S-methyl-5-thioribose-1-phosphate isomerase
MAQAFLESRDNDYICNAKSLLESTRPTAQNLFYAVERVFSAASPENEAKKIADKSVAECEAIGNYGQRLIEDGMRIATHCNAGWLACVDWGTATAPIYKAHRNGRQLEVYVDETRPRSQGARLTAWEMNNEKIRHCIIPDNALAHCMSQGEISLMIVGADRIAANGDVANKIGTLEKALAAKEFGIPFYVAAPLSTFDIKCKTGKDIPIENRSADEVLYQSGPDDSGEIRKILVCSPFSPAKNPAFDITPAKLVAGIITEKGIVKPDENEIMRLFEQYLQK